MSERNKKLPVAMMKAIAMCMNARVPFAVYCMPGSKTAQFGCPDPTKPFSLTWDGSPEQKGRMFVLSRFNQDEPEVPAIPLEWDATQITRFLKKHPDFSLTLPVAERVLDEKEDADKLLYTAQIKRIINVLRQPELSECAKVVLSRSRTIHTEILDVEQVGNNLFEQSQLYTYFYMAWHPETGFWSAATPEVAAIYRAADKRLSTMALAGTQPKRITISPDDWSSKNLREQNIVAAVIINTLKQMGAQFDGDEENVEVGELDMGNYCHLVSFLNFHFETDNLLKAMLRLTPTPAVLGFPAPLASNLIESLELHERECYGGFVGVVDGSTGDADLFVNLRCVTAARESNGCYVFRAYAGGGILDSSSPATEWNETDMKLSHTTHAVYLAHYSTIYK